MNDRDIASTVATLQQQLKELQHKALIGQDWPRSVRAQTFGQLQTSLTELLKIVQTRAETQTEVDARAAAQVLAGGGEMGALMRSFDWSASPLGPVAGWPNSLQTALKICLHSHFAQVIFWGPELCLLYNDAYRSILGDKHPAALGRPAHECWREIWPIIGPMLRHVLEAGQATWSENFRLLLVRHGYPEECYFTFSYSPI